MHLLTFQHGFDRVLPLLLPAAPGVSGLTKEQELEIALQAIERGQVRP